MPTIRVAVVVRGGSRTGAQLREGACEALEAHDWSFGVRAVTHQYSSIEEGVGMVLALAAGDSSERPHIIVGPTDSAVFVRAVDRMAGNDAQHVPILSPVVTADVELDDESWFFQLNAGVNARARVLGQFVSKQWPRSVAALHADSEFGRRAEAAFRHALEPSRRDRYIPLQYTARDPADIDAEDTTSVDWVRYLLRERPDVVAILGNAEDVLFFERLLRAERTGIFPYQPLLLTLLDVRDVAIDGLYVVSTVQATEEYNTDPRLTDARGLAHDTMRLALTAMENLGAASVQAEPQLLRLLIRDWQRGVEDIPRVPDETPDRTTLFTGADVALFRLDGTQQVSPIELGATPSVYPRVKAKIALLRGTYGLWPFLHLVMILGFTLVLSYFDITRSYQGSARHVMNRYSIGFCLFNSVLVGALYVYLCESGQVVWDRFIPAVLIALSPTAILRSTLFDTQTGKSVGLANLYDKLLGWVNVKIAAARFTDHQKFINCLAYYKDLGTLKKKLLAVQRDGQEAELEADLRTQLEEKIKSGHTNLEQRRRCAELLLERFDWQQLTDMELVPGEFRDTRLPGPEKTIVASEARIRQRPGLPEKVQRFFDEELDAIKERDENHYQRVTEELKKQEIGIATQLRFLVVEGHKQPSFFEKEELIEKDWMRKNRRPSWAARLTPSWFARLIARWRRRREHASV